MGEWKQKTPQIQYLYNDNLLGKLAKINGVNDIDSFLIPSVNDTHDFSKLKNIEQAVDLIKKHLLSKAKIVIFYDADQDGCESGAVLYRYLKNFTDNLELIHVQRHDGHGLHLVEDKIPHDTNLLIVVDSSTNEIDACQRVSSKGIPILIIDHHEWEGVDNLCATIVNPKMPDCDYPNKEASGTLVTWKVCCALDEYFSTDYATDLIDLAGFSLLADAMCTRESENRYYIKCALDNVRNLGLKILIEELKIDLATFDSTDFLYKVSPCITAVTRLGKLETALDLLLSDDVKECKKFAKELIKANERRKEIQKESVSLVKDQIDENDKIIVVVENSIGKSFNGVVSQELVSLYKRPAIVLGEVDGQLVGSYRTFGDFDMKGYLKTVKSCIQALGHKGAGGTACSKDELETFKREINEGLMDETFDNSLYYDLELDLAEIDENLIRTVKEFYKVCGKNLEVSKFLIRDAYSINKKILGSGDTLKVELCAESDTWFIDKVDLTPKLTMMKFKTTDEYINEFPIGKPIDVIGTLNTNVWIKYKPKYQVVKTNQIFIEDYRLSI